MIRADGVVVRLGGRTVLEDIDLTVRDGDVLGIVGPNGSGKTTLLRTLWGRQRPDRGRVLIDGSDLAGMPRRWIARQVAYVGQLLDPDPALRAGEEVAVGGIARHGAWHAQSRAFEPTILQALDEVGLRQRADDALHGFSGGERQRVSWARGIVHGAPHALLDEPSNHLDVRHRLELCAHLRTIAPTVVVVLHDLELAARACTRLALLDGGRLIATGTPDAVLRPHYLDPVYRVRTRRNDTPDGVLGLSFSLPHEKD